MPSERQVCLRSGIVWEDGLSDRNMEFKSLEGREDLNGRLVSPSANRNLEPILDAFREFGLTTGRVLEFGSGTGQHAAHIVQAFPDLTWLASDPDETSRTSCQAWAEHLGVADRMKVEFVDASKPEDLDKGAFDIIFSANVIHIAPVEVMDGLLGSSAALLGPEGRLVLYGPFSRNGEHNSAGNIAFDQKLRSTNPLWGIRDIDLDIVPRMAGQGFALAAVQPMPANNRFLVFEREG